VSTDSLSIVGLRVHAHHGVFAHERATGQPFVIDLTVWLDTAPAAEVDNLEHTVNYGELAQAVEAAVASEPVDLIETVAERVVQVAWSFALVRRVSVTVHKPEAPIPVPFDDVSVTLERTRDVPAVIALGANLGDRARTLREAIAGLGLLPHTRLLRFSSLWESAAVKPEGIDLDAPSYLNAVALVHTGLTASELLAALHQLEAEHGRERHERWGDRTLDLDIITWGQTQLATEQLTLPHPAAHERAFVLVPWHEMDAQAELPGHGPIAPLAEALRTQVRLPQEHLV
jgi:dihydroneopterin aldolase/2-amino-4-hydroxy-6-hydroxymethyldihydropteridine diphosphokinase